MALFRLKPRADDLAPAATYLQITNRGLGARSDRGVVWLGYDIRATTRMCRSTSASPNAGLLHGRRPLGLQRDCAWWASGPVSRLANFRYQEMSQTSNKVWKEIETSFAGPGASSGGGPGHL